MMPTNQVLRGLIQINMTVQGSAQDQVTLLSSLTNFLGQFGKKRVEPCDLLVSTHLEV